MTAKDDEAKELETCGVIMPISAIEGCDERHWSDVREILFSAIRDAEMTPQLVSDDVEVGIIHKRIVQNIYDNAVVVCDVSAKNPNVMLELGMRLAFDKPVIVVKDDKTSYSFDSSPIEHLTYPRDLRYQSIVTFQAALADKVKAMKAGKNENSFLKSFGTFKTAKLDTAAGTPIDLVLDELELIKSAIRSRSGGVESRDEVGSGADTFEARYIASREKDTLILCLRGSDAPVPLIMGAIKAMEGVTGVSRIDRGRNHFHLKVELSEGQTALARKKIMQLTERYR